MSDTSSWVSKKLSDIRCPCINPLCCGNMIFRSTLASRSANNRKNNLLMKLHRLISLNWEKSWRCATLGINIIEVAIKTLGNVALQKRLHTALTTSSPIIDQTNEKNRPVYPSRPSALSPSISKTTWQISSLVGNCSNIALFSSNKSSGIFYNKPRDRVICWAMNIFSKYRTASFPITDSNSTYSPLSFFILWITNFNLYFSPPSERAWSFYPSLGATLRELSVSKNARPPTKHCAA